MIAKSAFERKVLEFIQYLKSEDVMTVANEFYSKFLDITDNQEMLIQLNSRLIELAEKRNATLKEIRDNLAFDFEPESDTPKPVEPNPIPAKPKLLLSQFLRNNAQVNSHQFLSKGWSDQRRQQEIDYQKGVGSTCINIYAINHTNYSTEGHSGFWQNVPTNPTFYTPGEKDTWVHWINKAKAAGLEPIFWMMSNNKFDRNFMSFDRQDLNSVFGYWEVIIRNIIEPLGIKYLVLGLELDEYWSDAKIDVAGRWLKNRLPGVDIGAHNQRRMPEYFNQSWIDTIYYQYPGSNGTGTPLQAYDETSEVIERFNKPVVAAEYAFDGQSDWAAKRGTACLSAGAIGALTGFYNTRG
jgi:hypothetical protein